MPNRILKETICSSESIAQLSWFEEVFFYRLIVNCDDFGRFTANPSVLRNRLFQVQDGVTKSQIEKALEKLASIGMVSTYMVEDKPYLYMPTWGKYQNRRAKYSKYPEPEEADAALHEPTTIHCTEKDGKEGKNGMNTSAINCNQTQSDESICTRGIEESRNRGIEESRSRDIRSNQAKLDRTNTVNSRFSEFWLKYPKKVGKQKAQKAWERLKPDRTLTDLMLAAIEKQSKTDQWTKNGGQFIPHPTTWLNEGRWEDDVSTYPQTRGKPIDNGLNKDYSSPQDEKRSAMIKAYLERQKA